MPAHFSTTVLFAVQLNISKACSLPLSCPSGANTDPLLAPISPCHPSLKAAKAVQQQTVHVLTLLLLPELQLALLVAEEETSKASGWVIF